MNVFDSEDKSHIQLTHKLQGKILLVEDNKTNQMLVNLLLNDLGLEADIAEDGIEAVEMFRKNKYDIILMDENMPRMCGTDATRIIRKDENDKKLIPTPIIALTSNVFAADKERFLAAGMDELVPKPINNELFISLLHKFLSVKVVD